MATSIMVIQTWQKKRSLCTVTRGKVQIKLARTQTNHLFYPFENIDW